MAPTTHKTQTLTNAHSGHLDLKGGESHRNLLERPVFQSKLEEQRHVKERLAAAFRVLHLMNLDEGVSGHITVRDPINPHAFWINPFGKSFDQMTVSDLLLLDHDGNVLEGGKEGEGQIYNVAGYAIHGAIHKTRQDLHAACHSHTMFGRAFSVLGRNVDMASYAAAGFADTVKLYNTFGGVVLDEQEGQHICEALGENGKAVILQNHGILSAAQTVDATIAFYIRLEQLCESQLIADAAGEPLTMANKDIQLVFARNGGEEAAWEQAQELFELVDQVSGGDYKL